MEFRTEIDISPFAVKIDHSTSVFSIGSCFAESIAGRLRRMKFTVESNPFGVLYNPVSIASALESLGSGRSWSEKDLDHDGGLWFSFDHHSSFSSVSASQTAAKINEAAERGASALSRADHVMITFGTAWIYQRGGRVVANCHKQPASLFTRRRLTVEETVAWFSPILEGPLKNKRVIFTVSPVRHLQDGFEENSLSKSILRLAVDDLVGLYDNAFYFPACEIVNDDLRDYRFYGADLVHPSEEAVEYVWEKFSAAAFTEDTRRLLTQIEAIVRAASHRVFNTGTDAHVKFCRTMLRRACDLQERYPVLDLSTEIGFFGNSLP